MFLPINSAPVDVSGKRIGPFQLFSAVGQGRTGVVYRAYDVERFEDVAFKLFHPHIAADVAYMEQVRAAVAAAPTLSHYNLVPLIKLGVLATDLAPVPLTFLVMGYIDGRSLARILAVERRLPSLDAFRIADTVGAVLDHLHRQGTLHGDVKPANILLGHDGRVHLADQGLAPPLDGLGGATQGTAAYMAPEQAIAFERAGPQSDLYALAVSLYEMLTGQLPWPDDAPYDLERARRPQPLQPSALLRARVAPLVADQIERALDPDPARRPRSAIEFSLALRQANATTSSLQTFQMRDPPATLLTEEQRPSCLARLMLPLMVGAAAVLVVAASLWGAGW